MAQYRKKPVVIEAIQYTSRSLEELEAFCPGATYWLHSGYMIPTLEGDMLLKPGDWIVKGVKGEFYPCKPDIFEMTYDKVEGGETLETEQSPQ